MVVGQPIGSTFKFSYVQCTKCGAVIGFTEFDNISVTLAKQNEAIKKIAAALNISVTPKL